MRLNALKFLLKPRLLYPGVSQTGFERVDISGLGALERLEFGARAEQLIAHRAKFSPLGFGLRHCRAGGARLGIGAFARVLEFRANTVDFVLFGGDLAHRHFRLAAIRHHLAQQRVAVANQVTESLEAFEHSQVSAWSGGRNVKRAGGDSGGIRGAGDEACGFGVGCGSGVMHGR